MSTGTTQQIIRVIEKKDRNQSTQTSASSSASFSSSSSSLSSSSSSMSNEMILIVKEELTTTNSLYKTLRRRTVDELEKMGYDLSKFAKGLGNKLGMSLNVKQTAISKEAPKSTTKRQVNSRMAQMANSMKEVSIIVMSWDVLYACVSVKGEDVSICIGVSIKVLCEGSIFGRVYLGVFFCHSRITLITFLYLFLSSSNSAILPLKKKKREISVLTTSIEEEANADTYNDDYDEEEKCVVVPMPKKRQGSGAEWIANKEGRLKEFAQVQKKMQEQMMLMSSEQLKERERMAIRIQRIVRGRMERHSVKTLRAQRLQEKKAKEHLLNLKKSPKNQNGKNGQHKSSMWDSIDDVERNVMRMERRTKTHNNESPRGWGDDDAGKFKNSSGNSSSNSSNSSSNQNNWNGQGSQNKNGLTKWDKENLMTMKKRIMKLERRVREVSKMLVKNINSKNNNNNTQNASSHINDVNNTNSHHLHGQNHTQGSDGGMSSSGLPSYSSNDYFVVNDDDNNNNIQNEKNDDDEEEEEWPMERSTFLRSKLGLTHSYAKTEHGTMSPDQWRQERGTTYRMPFGGRAEKYRLNRQMFRRWIDKHNQKREKRIRQGDAAVIGAGDTIDTGPWGGNNNNNEQQTMQSMTDTGREKEGTSSSSSSLTAPSTLMADREPRGVTWVVKMLRQVYDDKLVAEAASFRNGYRAPSLPQYLSEWASTRYGMPALVEQMCWDLYHSCQHYREYSLEIDTFAKFVDEESSTEELSFYLFSRNLVLCSVGENKHSKKSTNKVDLQPPPIPLSVAVNLSTTILKHATPTQQMELLFRLDQSSLPMRPMNAQLKLDMSNILNRNKNKNRTKNSQAKNSKKKNQKNSITYDKYFNNQSVIGNQRNEEEEEEEERRTRREDERQSLFTLKERLLNQQQQNQQQKERTIEMDRYLYLLCRSFRSCQRSFKRRLKQILEKERYANDPTSKDLKDNETEDSKTKDSTDRKKMRRRHATESEFIEGCLQIEPHWTSRQARAIFAQGQTMLSEQHEREGFGASMAKAAQLKISLLTTLSVQMWSHLMLLPHAQVGTTSGIANDNSVLSLERKLQSLLGAVESHWPSFEPNFSKVSNRLAYAMQSQHGIQAPLDASHQVLASSSASALNPLNQLNPLGASASSLRPHEETTKYIKIDVGTRGRRTVDVPTMRPSFTSGGERGGKNTGGGGGGGW